MVLTVLTSLPPPLPSCVSGEKQQSDEQQHHTADGQSLRASDLQQTTATTAGGLLRETHHHYYYDASARASVNTGPAHHVQQGNGSAQMHQRDGAAAIEKELDRLHKLISDKENVRLCLCVL